MRTKRLPCVESPTGTPRRNPNCRPLSVERHRASLTYTHTHTHTHIRNTQPLGITTFNERTVFRLRTRIRHTVEVLLFRLVNCCPSLRSSSQVQLFVFSFPTLWEWVRLAPSLSCVCEQQLRKTTVRHRAEVNCNDNSVVIDICLRQAGLFCVPPQISPS